MRELVRTNDAVLVTAVQALLNAAQIHHLVFDQNMSVLEGSLGVLPRRVLVADDDVPAARRLLEDAGLAHELRPDVRASAGIATTRDAVLGGRLTLTQPKKGHRVGHDAILLAAAVDAAAAERAVDLGAGVGAAGLALARRVVGVEVVLAEIDEALCEMARENVRSNALNDRVRVLSLDVTASGAFDAAGIEAGSVQQVLMNPPFNDPARHNASPDARRRLAHVAEPDTLPLWVNTASRLLANEGTLTLIWRADDLPAVREALAGFGSIWILPIAPKPGGEPIRVIVRAKRGGNGIVAACAPLVLNSEAGHPSEAAEAILRGGASLSFRPL